MSVVKIKRNCISSDAKRVTVSVPRKLVEFIVLDLVIKDDIQTI